MISKEINQGLYKAGPEFPLDTLMRAKNFLSFPWQKLSFLLFFSFVLLTYWDRSVFSIVATWKVNLPCTNLTIQTVHRFEMLTKYDTNIMKYIDWHIKGRNQNLTYSFRQRENYLVNYLSSILIILVIW